MAIRSCASSIKWRHFQWYSRTCHYSALKLSRMFNALHSVCATAKLLVFFCRDIPVHYQGSATTVMMLLRNICQLAKFTH